MRYRYGLIGVGMGLAMLLAFRAWFGPAPLTAQEVAAAWQTPLPPPAKPLRSYHLGHSLVGRDIPFLLAQMGGHEQASQLGWGASLGNHWQDKVPGFAEENAHPAHQPARPSLQGGSYDALILTEMVELRDAIRYHDSARNLARWAALARAANPGMRIYLYETWHRLDDPAGWENRIRQDLPDLWIGNLIAGAMARQETGTIHLIPGGQVLAAAVSAAEAGTLPGLTDRASFFSTQPDGTPDLIHLGPTGAYLIALVHYAVLYQRDPLDRPETAPDRLTLADGRRLALPAPTARALQALVWPIVSTLPGTGIGTQP